jgi:hypothetical protein
LDNRINPYPCRHSCILPEVYSVVREREKIREINPECPNQGKLPDKPGIPGYSSCLTAEKSMPPNAREEKALPMAAKPGDSRFAIPRSCRHK